jgi:hypothetical protein
MHLDWICREAINKNIELKWDKNLVVKEISLFKNIRNKLNEKSNLKATEDQITLLNLLNRKLEIGIITKNLKICWSQDFYDDDYQVEFLNTIRNQFYNNPNFTFTDPQFRFLSFLVSKLQSRWSNSMSYKQMCFLSDIKCKLDANVDFIFTDFQREFLDIINSKYGEDGSSPNIEFNKFCNHEKNHQTNISKYLP